MPLGILVWQDLPLQWGLQRAAKEPARRIARAAVDALGHHPSIAVWCAHHEPWVGDPATRRGPDARRRGLRTAMAQALPSWNRSVLDRSVALVLEKSDGSRPVVAHAGVWPHLPQLSGTSTHLWAGWRWGGIDSLPRLLRAWPRLGRFVGEFGAQAPGPTPEFLGRRYGRWPDLDWDAIAADHALEVDEARRIADPTDHPDEASWAAALQEHQAEVVRSHVETLRRLKYRPTGGFTAFALADPAPGITAALLDHERRPKPAWTALTEACAPVIAVIDRPPGPDASRRAPRPRGPRRQRPAQRHRPPSASRPPRTGACRTTEVAPSASDPDPIRQVWDGEIDGDTVSHVGTRAAASCPDRRPALVLDLRWTGPDGIAGHRRHRRTVAPR